MNTIIKAPFPFKKEKIDHKLPEFSHPYVTIDVLIFTIENDELKILLVKRDREPFKGEYALPGGFVRIDESLEDTIGRKLEEETGVKNVYLEQLYTFGEPKRDPRERVITVAYFALIPRQRLIIRSATDKREARFFSVKKLPQLAFDHRKIVLYGMERLKAKAGYSNIAFGLLPEVFKLSELQKVYEIILDHKLDKRNFRKKMQALGILQSTGEKEMDGAHRPALLYKFKNREIVIID